MDSREVEGFRSAPPPEGQEPSRKKGKTEQESKTDELAKKVFEESEEYEATESPPLSRITESPPLSRKRERPGTSEPITTATSEKTKKAKSKTQAVEKRILPYRSHFGKETGPLVKDVADIASQNTIKKAADTLFTSVTDKELRDQVVTLTTELPVDQRAPFLERVGVYIECSPKSLEFFAKVPPEDRMGVINSLDKFEIPDKLKKELFRVYLEGTEKIAIGEFVKAFKSVSFLFPEPTSGDTALFLLGLIQAIAGNSRTSEVISQLSPLLQNVTDPLMRLAILGSIFEKASQESATPAHLLEDLIKQTTPYLNAAAKSVSLLEKIDTLMAYTKLFLTIEKFPPEKRNDAIATSSYILEADGSYWKAAASKKTLEKIAISQVDAAISQTKNFLNQFGASLQIDENKKHYIFEAFATIPPEQYDDIVEKAKPFLINVSGDDIKQILMVIADVPVALRNKLISNVNALLQPEPPKIEVYKQLSKIPAEQLDSFVATIAPLIIPYGYDNISAFLDLCDETKLHEAQETIKHASHFLKNALELLPGKLTRISFIIEQIKKIPAHEREDVLDKLLTLVKALPSRSNLTELDIASFMPSITKIAPQEREDVLREVLKMACPDTIPIRSAVPFYIDIIAAMPADQRENAVATINQLFTEMGRRRPLDTWDTRFLSSYILPELEKIPIEERHAAINSVLDVIRSLPKELYIKIDTISKLLFAIGEVPTDQRTSVVAYTNQLLAINGLSYPLVIINGRTFMSAEFDTGPGTIFSIPSTLADIPPEERESVIAYTKQLLEGRECTIKEMTNIISSLCLVSLEERERVVGQVLDCIDEEADADFIEERIDFYNSYTLEIARGDINDRPLELLAQIAKQIEEKCASWIQVSFSGEEGQDAGGLGRAFISELFAALKTKLAFQVRESTGLCAPVANGELSKETIEAYQNMGRLMMFCLNSLGTYPIGMIFEQPVFAALIKFKEHHFAQPIEKLVQNRETYNELLDIYVAINRLDESAQATLEWLQNNKDDPAAKPEIQSMLISVFEPLIEIAKGMKDVRVRDITFQEVQQATPNEFSEALQGVVDEEMILEQLKFGKGISDTVAEWVRDWIKNSDDTQHAEFLSAMTGSPALGPKPLNIKACIGEIVIFHTCSNTVELPLDILTSQENLNLALNNVIGGGKFTLA